MLFNLIYTPIISISSANELDSNSGLTTLNIYAPCALLIEKSSGDILYQKEAYTAMYPASTVKIMTAILVLENSNLDDPVTVSQNAISLVPKGYVSTDILPGEILSVRTLLYLLLIPSGNDAANVLAEYVGGNIENFASMMNQKAIQIGCKNTNFTNPNGVHDVNMHTTAYDLALMARYAMDIEEFRTIVSTPTFTLPSTNLYPKSDRVFQNSNHLIHSTSQYYYQYATGIKTGYTNAAQNCLVSSAKVGDVEFIAVILGSTFGNTTNESKFVDAKNLLDFGFTYHYDYYQTKIQNQKLNIWAGFLNFETGVNPDLVVDENNKPRWGYVFYLIARTVLLFIAIIYVIYHLTNKIKRFRYNRTHAKYDYKY